MLNASCPPIVTPNIDPITKGLIQVKLISFLMMRARKKLEFACVTACTGITAIGFIKYINAVIVIIPPPKPIEAESADAKKLIKQSIINSIDEIIKLCS
jgi:hypothetical protein